MSLQRISLISHQLRKTAIFSLMLKGVFLQGGKLKKKNGDWGDSWSGGADNGSNPNPLERYCVFPLRPYGPGKPPTSHKDLAPRVRFCRHRRRLRRQRRRQPPHGKSAMERPPLGGRWPWDGNNRCPNFVSLSTQKQVRLEVQDPTSGLGLPGHERQKVLLDQGKSELTIMGRRRLGTLFGTPLRARNIVFGTLLMKKWVNDIVRQFGTLVEHVWFGTLSRTRIIIFGTLLKEKWVNNNRT